MKKCSRCGESLRQITSVASDAHDEQVLYCPCWPTDTLDWLAPIVGVGLFIGMLLLTARFA